MWGGQGASSGVGFDGWLVRMGYINPLLFSLLGIPNTLLDDLLHATWRLQSDKYLFPGLKFRPSIQIKQFVSSMTFVKVRFNLQVSALRNPSLRSLPLALIISFSLAHYSILKILLNCRNKCWKFNWRAQLLVYTTKSCSLFLLNKQEGVAPFITCFYFFKLVTMIRFYLALFPQLKCNGMKYNWSGLPFPSPEFPIQEPNPGLLNCRHILYQLSYKGSPKM